MKLPLIWKLRPKELETDNTTFIAIANDNSTIAIWNPTTKTLILRDAEYNGCIAIFSEITFEDAELIASHLTMLVTTEGDI